MIQILAKYASDLKERNHLWNIFENRVLYLELVDKPQKSLSDILSEFKSIHVPLSVVLAELLSTISVRYYSISSSSLETPENLSITAVVVRYALLSKSSNPAGPQKPKLCIKEGLTTSWFERLHHQDVQPSPQLMETRISSVPPYHVPIYIRSSNFKLPKNPQTPIIMVGPGTGIAPFRGFIRERVLMAESGQQIGTTLLFYGCRHHDKVCIFYNNINFDIV